MPYVFIFFLFSFFPLLPIPSFPSLPETFSTEKLGEDKSSILSHWRVKGEQGWLRGSIRGQGEWRQLQRRRIRGQRACAGKRYRGSSLKRVSEHRGSGGASRQDARPSKCTNVRMNIYDVQDLSQNNTGRNRCVARQDEPRVGSLVRLYDGYTGLY